MASAVCAAYARAGGSRKQLLGSLSTGHGAVEAELKTRETAAA